MEEEKKIGVASIIYVTADATAMKQIYQEQLAKNPEAFYMVYAVNMDKQLDLQEHYPSLAFTL